MVEWSQVDVRHGRLRLGWRWQCRSGARRSRVGGVDRCASVIDCASGTHHRVREKLITVLPSHSEELTSRTR